MTASSVFITKKWEEISLISAYCSAKNLTLEAQSLISFEFIPQEITIQADVYFFGSKNAFDFFLKLDQSLKGKEIAVIGQATKLYVEKKGFSVAFFGKEAGNPQKVALEIKSWLGERRIAFFQSDISKRSIANFISENQKQEFVIYQTKLIQRKQERVFDVYVFTSPSNVDAFCKINKLPKTALIVSWGKSTDQALSAKGFRPNYSLKSASQEELLTFFDSL